MSAFSLRIRQVFIHEGKLKGAVFIAIPSSQKRLALYSLPDFEKKTDYQQSKTVLNMMAAQKTLQSDK